MIEISQKKVLIHQRTILRAVNEVEAKRRTVSIADIGTTAAAYSDAIIRVIRISARDERSIDDTRVCETSQSQTSEIEMSHNIKLFYFRRIPILFGYV